MLEYYKYALAKKWPKYDISISINIGKLVKKLKSQMKAPFFDIIDPIALIASFAILKLACEQILAHKGASLHVLPNYVNERLAYSFNSSMGAEDNSTLFTHSVHNNDGRLQKCLCSYSEVLNYLLKKFRTDCAIVDFDTTVLR